MPHVTCFGSNSLQLQLSARVDISGCLYSRMVFLQVSTVKCSHAHTRTHVSALTQAAIQDLQKLPCSGLVVAGIPAVVAWNEKNNFGALLNNNTKHTHTRTHINSPPAQIRRERWISQSAAKALPRKWNVEKGKQPKSSKAKKLPWSYTESKAV